MDTQAQQFYNMHLDTSLGLSMTGNAQTLELMVTVMRKKTMKPFALPEGLNVITIWSLKLVGRRGRVDDTIIDTVFASLRYGGINYRNFDFEHIK
eukprot:11076186-Karenia_brevis.AAC.1